MSKAGKKQIEIASLLGVNKNSVNTWCSNYKKDGGKGFKEKARGHKKEDGRLLLQHKLRRNIPFK